MKMVIAIVQDYDTDRLLSDLTELGLRATRIASTGGFLRTGNTTVFMGVEDGDVRTCLQTIRTCCQARSDRRPDALLVELDAWSSLGVADVTIGGAVVFVLAIERTIRMPTLHGAS